MSNPLTALQASKILIIDDEASFQNLIKTQLEKKEFEVISCLNSEEATHLIEETRPDVILMDLMMPEIDGFSLIRNIRNQKMDFYIPIVVLTARSEIKDLVHSLQLGADDYITKPFELDELLARIQNMLRLKNIQDSLFTRTKELDEANNQINHLNQSLTDANRELKKKVYDLHNIFEISFKVMGQTEEDRLVNTALLNALGIFTAKSVMLLLADQEDKDLFIVKESKGFLSSQTEDFSIRRQDKLLNYLEFIRKPLHIRELVYEFEEIMPQFQEMDIRALAPLFQEDELMGILCLGSSVSGQDYPLDVMEMLGILANMLSVALHNARNFDQIKAMSYTDEMTGLHNYRFFTMRLKEEIARAKRNRSNFSLLIMDVDFFKNYNDALGHPAGDEILRQLSKILKNAVRDNDIVARYGGEEFAIISPSTDEKGAAILA
ncbi:MAG: diguanylate cyclase, partial [Calditrichaeota bacterium]